VTDQPWVARVRAVIADHGGRLLFVENDDRHRLPFVEVERTDEELPAIREALAGLTGVETIVVRAIERSVDEERKVLELALELEPLGITTSTPRAVWRSAEELDGLRLTDDDRALVKLYAADRPPPERPLWARRGWFAEAALWIEETLARHGRGTAAPIEQVSSWCISSVLRAETEDGRVFFKATAHSPLFVDEGTVTQGLAVMFPGRVPLPIAVDPDRRWMLLDDFGPVVGWNADLETRTAVLSTFARMQLETTSRQGELLELGALDRRPAWLASRIVSLLRSPEAFGLEDDERDRLSALEPRFVEMCERLATGAVPDALVHGDLHLSNVAGDGDGYVFFDWTDACLTHPFLDLLVVLFEEDAEIRRSLRDAYLGVWAGVAPEDELLELWAVAEPLASLNQAISYRSIAANVERGAAPDLESMIPYWLRKALVSSENT
jgi:Phosphotransferase enzyme family